MHDCGDATVRLGRGEFIRGLPDAYGIRTPKIGQQARARRHHFPLKIPFDIYRSLPSGITVTTRFPVPTLFATSIAQKTLAPPLDPPRIPSLRAISITMPNASVSRAISTPSQTLKSNVLGMKLAPIPSTR